MPKSAHSGNADQILKNRHQVLLEAYYADPIRFNNKMPNQQNLQPAYINPLENIFENDLHKEEIMAS